MEARPTLTDEESDRGSFHAGELKDAGEEAQQDLDPLTLPELHSLVQDMSHANAILKLEAEMFEKFLHRMEPRDLTSHLMPEKVGSSLDLGQAAVSRARRKSKSRMPADRMLSLTVEQKFDFAQRELEETKENVQRMKENSERILQNYLAVLDEADIRIVDIKKAIADFEKDIVKTIIKKKGSIIASDKVMRYMEEKICSRDVLKEKIRLKNDSLKAQKKNMQMQLKQKEELGEALHEVDVQQLKIENAQFLEKIEERNQDLLQQKMTAGNALQILNTYEKKLHIATAMATRLVKDITQRKESIEKIEREFIAVEEDRSKAEIINKRLRKQLAYYKVPPVLDYVHEKMLIQELESNIKIWERKVEIAQMALLSYRSVWQKAKMASRQLQALLPEQVIR